MFFNCFFLLLNLQKHHYRELSNTVREILGKIPDQFIAYWMNKFPKLLLHTWLAMQCIRHEDLFRRYYCNSFTFPPIHDGSIPIWIQQCLCASPTWRMRNKNVSKFGYRFPIMVSSDKSQVYSWRQRPNLNSESNEITKNLEIANEKTVVEQYTVLESPLVVEEKIIANKENEEKPPVELIKVQKLWIENQENVEPEDIDLTQLVNEELIVNDEEKWKKVRPRRGRCRNKKKQVNASNI